MTIQPLVFFPDQRLRQVALPVTLFDHSLHDLTTNLLDTLHAAHGIGITGPHIGISQRVVVLDLPDAHAPQIYINPEIVWRSESKIQNEEGSISMPGISACVERSAAIKINYADLEGQMHNADVTGLCAICIQHEIDQLDGIFWLQRLSSLRRNRLIARYRKIVRT